MLRKAQAVVQKTSRKNVTATVLIFLMGVMGGKITINVKNCTKIEKEETHAHRKRASSALSTERALEL